MKRVEKDIKNRNIKKILIVVLSILLVCLIVVIAILSKNINHKTIMKNQAIEATKKYIEDLDLQFSDSVSIPVSLLAEGNYIDSFNNECINSSYIIVTKDGDEYKYDPVIICDNSQDSIILNGENIQDIEVGHDYIEEGATIEGDTTEDIIINSSVDTNKTGTYSVNYNIPNLDIPPVLRIINVVDTKSPILQLKGSDIVYLLVGDTYKESGYKAIDNYDGDVTSNVFVSGNLDTSKEGTYYITYKVSDSSNNETIVKRQIIVRKSVPTITLKGYGTVYVNVFDKYIEDGYVANDEKDGNITKKVVISENVNTNVVGSYLIIYSVTNSNGVVATVRRIINVVDNENPLIVLNGNSEVTLEWNVDSYKELGVKATDNYDGNLSSKVKITGLFNPNKIGTYYLTYTVTDNSGNKSATQRIIKVVDRESPVVTLNGDSKVYVEAGTTYKELGANVSDNHDNDIKVNISGNVNNLVLGEYEISYTATDSSNNITSVTRTVIVQDTTKPTITLNGSNIINLELGTSYSELGAVATDNYDHFVNNNIVIDGEVNYLKEGTYYVTYDVTDISGNIADTVIRTIVVKDTIAPTIELNSDDLFINSGYAQNANVNIKVNDEFNDIKYVKYAWTESLDVPNVYNDLSDYLKNSITVLENNTNGIYYLHVSASDLNNNVSNKVIGPFKIDNIKPEIVISPNGLISQSLSTVVSASDQFSGIDKIYYAWSDNNIEPSDYSLYLGNTLTQTEDGKYYLWVKAIDNAGNIAKTVSNQFIVDNSYPSINFEYSDSDIVKQITINVNAIASNDKGISKIEYAWTNSNSEPNNYLEWNLTNYKNNNHITMPANADGTYYLWIKVTDSNGLISYNSSKPLTLDTTKPDIEVSPNGTSNSVQKIDVDINVDEDNIDKIYWAISTDSDINNVTLNNALDKSDSTITLSSLTGTYYLHIYALDKAGNYSNFTSNVYKLDNEQPVNPLITYNSNWTNQDIEVNIFGTDNIYYSFDNENWISYDANNKPVVSENTMIYAKANDEAGNTSETISSRITNIDKITPTIDLDYSADLTNKLKVDYNVSDNSSGIKEIYYAWTMEDIEPLFENTIDNLSGEITKNDVDGKYYLWIKTIDNAGNEEISKTSLLELDNTNPVVEITNNGTINPVTSQTSNINITDNSNLDIKYIWSTSNKELEVNNDWTSWNNYSESQALTLDNSYEDGIYYLHVLAIDRAGNETYFISNSYTLVNNKPNVSYDPTTDLDYAKEVSSKVSVNLSNANITDLYYAWSTSTDESMISDWLEFNNGDTLNKNDGTGKYYLFIKVIDNVDNNRTTIVRSIGTFNLDNETANVTLSSNGTGEIPVRKAETIIYANDDQSGIKDVKYSWGTSNLISPELNLFSNYEIGSKVIKDTENTYETWYLWVYVSDQAGNENYFVSNAYTIDNSYPEITLNPEHSNPVNNLDVSVDIDVDSNKKISNIYYAWDTSSNISDSTIWEIWNLDDYENNNILSQSNLDGTYYLHIKVVDSSNLVAVKSTYELIFDNTNPVIGITPDSSDIPVQKIESNVTVLEENDYDVYYSFTSESDISKVSFQEWTNFMGKGTDTLSFGGTSEYNGKYYLYIKVVDVAGNTSYLTKDYVLDNIAPESPTIEYNSNWTNQNVEITISGSDILQYSYDLINWTDYDNENKPEIESNNTTIYARTIDIAGNVSDVTNAKITNIDKVAQNISLAKSTTDWTNSDVNISVIIDKSESPVTAIKWSAGGLTVSDFRNNLGNDIDHETMQFSISENSNIEIYVCDAAGNETIENISISNIDKQAPVINVDPLIVIINEDTNYNLFSDITVTDNIGLGNNEFTVSDFSTEQPGTYIVTYTISDIAGNIATATRTIIVKDTTAPKITLNGESEITLEVHSAYNELGSIVIDNYDSSLEATINGTVNTDVIGKYYVNYQSTDTAGNTSTLTRTVNVVDTTKPVITLNGESEITLEVHSPYNELGSIVTDNYDSSLEATISGEVNTDVVGTYTLSYDVTDANGNVANTVTRTINVVDTTKPVITLNGDAEETIEVHNTYTEEGASVTDNYDSSLEATISGTLNTDVVGTYTLNYNVTDASGNIADTVTRTINVVDTTKPIITLNGDAEETIEVHNTYTEEGAFATDNYDSDLTVTINGTVNTDVIGKYYVNYQSTDTAGNTSTLTRTVNVVDTTAPVITLNGDGEITLEVHSAYDELGSIVTDNYDTDIEATISGTLNTDVVGTYTLNYNVTDASGNIANTVTRTINVVDTTKPAITLNGDAEETIEVHNTYTEEGASVTDNYDSDLTVTTSGIVNTNVVGTYTLNYNVTDASGNVADTVTRTINVVDTTAPVITLNGESEITLEVHSAYDELGSIVTDNYDTDLTVTISGTVNTDVIGTYTLNYNVTDANGNVADTVTRIVNVVDTTAPVITLNGESEITLEVHSPYNELGSIVTDNYDSSLEATISGEVNTDVVGTYTLSYDVTDANGNVADTVTRIVNVVDTTKPVITLNGESEITLEVHSAYNELGSIVTDNYDTDLTVTISGILNTDVVGTYTLNYNVTDVSGNIADIVTRIVNVVDTTSPVITLNGESEITLEVHSAYDELGSIVTDNYDTDLTVTISGTLNTDVVGTYTLNYNVTDASENVANTVTRIVNVVDTTKPVITLNGDAEETIEVHNTYTEEGASVTDNYDTDLEATISDEVNIDVVGVYTLNYNVTDANGNVADIVTRIVNVVDTTAPVITLNGDAEETIEVHSAYNELGSIVTDNYDTDIEATISGEVNTDVVGIYTLNYNVTDASGNIANTVTRTINVVDTTKPVITLNGESEITLEVHSAYNELGSIVTDNYDSSLEATISGEVNTDVVGTYTLNYNVSDVSGNIADKVTRIVNVVDTTKPLITLIGNEIITIPVGSTYNDQGALFTDNYDADRTLIESGIVNTDVVGTYYITYNATDDSGNQADFVTRTVKVVDDEAPIININGDALETIEVGDSYTELGATVVDNYDIGLTAEITGTVDTTKLGTYTITYTANDSNNNVSVVTKEVAVVDTTAPKITLNGESTINIDLDDTYTEQGAEVTDNYDTNLTVAISGNVDTTKVGTYTITYISTDNSNNKVKSIRIVNVIANSLDSLFRDDSNCESNTSCISEGNLETNYVWYSGYLWRIYKSNSNGEVKMITEGSISSMSYDDSSATYSNSVIANWLNNTFYNSLNNADNMVLNDSLWCNLNTANADNNRTTCTLSSIVTSKVGLLTLFEYNLVGGEDSFLNNGDHFFTMTVYNNSSVWSIGANGEKSPAEMTYNVEAIRPVITLISGINAYEGDGSINNPFRIEGDISADEGTSLTSRFTGEYVSFNNQLWRVVSSDSNGTKLILDSYLKDSNNQVIETVYGDNNSFSLLTGIGSALNNYYRDVTGLLDTAWNESEYAVGNNPIGTSIRNDNSYINAKAGLIRIGELMSGNSETLDNKGITYWTMTKNSNGQVWHISTAGSGAYSDLSSVRAIRPVIKINSNFTINSGKGTYSNPYKLR